MLTFFFFNDTATTEIYTLSLHDALPISCPIISTRAKTASSTSMCGGGQIARTRSSLWKKHSRKRSEEHTSELQSPCNLVCRLLLEKKKNTLIALCQLNYFIAPQTVITYT